MKILVDIGHPAHVHFFAQPMRIWLDAGFQVLVTSRQKEIATDLLDALGVTHQVLSEMNSGTLRGMVSELYHRDRRLLRVIRREKPDILVGIGGIFIAHAGFFTRTPSLVFYDTENATLQNLLTYPLCSLVVVPSCYNAWLPPWHLRYPGYHELSYLHPNGFTPDRKIAMNCGLDPERPTFLIRTVSWQASHDLQERGWSVELLRQIVAFLNEKGKVLISTEGELPNDLQPYAYGGNPESIHHLMGHLSLLVGESATMASECAVMGVPSIYAAHTGRGYTDEQEERYGLVTNLRDFSWHLMKQVMMAILSQDAAIWRDRQQKMLQDKTDVAPFVAELVSQYPQSRPYFQRLFVGRN